VTSIFAPSLSLLQTTSSASSDILGALYGSASASGTNPVTALQLALKSQPKAVADEAKQPQVARDIAAFRKAVAAAPDAKSLLADPVARKVLLTANGLGSQTDFAALATKALLSDTSKDGSLVSKLPNTQWLNVAKTFDFANKGLAVLKDPKVLDTIANGYAEVNWRDSLEAATPGLSKALDFRSRASSITSAYQVLGDSTLRTVITTALGIPPQIAYQSLDAQAKAVTDRVDLTKFKDPKFVDQFTRRYLIASSSGQSAGLVV